MDDRYTQLLEENQLLNSLLTVNLTQQSRAQNSSNHSSSAALFIVTKLAKQTPEPTLHVDFPMPEGEVVNYSEDLDSKARAFVSSLSESVDLKSLSSVLASRLLNEQALRLNAEEKATHLISKEEGKVGQLESQVKDLERQLLAN
jgi:hypothetical protein